jgi:hypothetical protein
MSAYISEAGRDAEGRAVSARKVHVWQVVLAQEGPERSLNSAGRWPDSILSTRDIAIGSAVGE